MILTGDSCVCGGGGGGGGGGWGGWACVACACVPDTYMYGAWLLLKSQSRHVCAWLALICMCHVFECHASAHMSHSCLYVTRLCVTCLCVRICLCVTNLRSTFIGDTYTPLRYLCMYANASACVRWNQSAVWLGPEVCMHVCMCEYIFWLTMYTCICMHAYAYMYTCICMYAHMYTCICMHAYAYMYTCICKDACV